MNHPKSPSPNVCTAGSLVPPLTMKQRNPRRAVAKHALVMLEHDPLGQCLHNRTARIRVVLCTACHSRASTCCSPVASTATLGDSDGEVRTWLSHQLIPERGAVKSVGTLLEALGVLSTGMTMSVAFIEERSIWAMDAPNVLTSTFQNRSLMPRTESMRGFPPRLW